MPVLVAAAHEPLARRLVTRLLDEGGEVRAYGSEATPDLRAAGAIVATGSPDDEGRLESALAEVHTAVLVPEPLLVDPDVLVDEVSVLVRAATGAAVRRLITLSMPGADPDAADPLRRAFGRVEAMLADAQPPSIAIRVSLIDTPGVRDVLATAGLDPLARAVEVAPVGASDLLELVVAFDRARSNAASGHLVVAADGPVRMPVDDYLDRFGAVRPGRGRLVGRQLVTAPERERLATALAAGPWWTEDPVVVDGWAFAGLDPASPSA